MLQAAFESYKLQLMDEMNEKLNRRLNEVRQELSEDANDQLQELRKQNSQSILLACPSGLHIVPLFQCGTLMELMWFSSARSHLRGPI